VSPETGKRPPETQNVDAQTTFTLEITVGMRKLSRKTASNLQCGKYQDLIRGSLGQEEVAESAQEILPCHRGRTRVILNPLPDSGPTQTY